MHRQKRLLLTFDAFGTLFTPRESIGQQYVSTCSVRLFIALELPSDGYKTHFWQGGFSSLRVICETYLAAPICMMSKAVLIRKAELARKHGLSGFTTDQITSSFRTGKPQKY